MAQKADMAHVSQVRKPTPLKIDAATKQRLDLIIHSGKLSVPKLRKIRVIRALGAGQKGADIAAREGLSPQRVSDILQEVAESSVEVEIERLVEAPKRMDRKPATRRAGRPGYQYFDEWIKNKNPIDETFFEITTLILSPEFQMASIAFGPSHVKAAFDTPKRGNDSDSILFARIKLLKEARAAINTPVFWTRVSTQDSVLENIFSRLRLFTPQEPVKSVSALRDRFGPDICHLVLSSGSKKLCDRYYKQITRNVTADHITADSKIGFLNHLEAILYRRRLTNSGVGFLPALPRLFDHIRERTGANASRDDEFVWTTDQAEVIKYLKVGVVTQDYFAVRGILPGLNSFLAPKIAYFDDIQFRTLPVSTQVEASKIDADHIRVLVRPMPGLEYFLLIPWSKSKEEFEKHARERLKDDKNARKLIYSTRQQPGGEARSSIALPEEFLKNPRSRKAGKPRGVVLLPRHFVINEGEIDIDMIQQLIADQKVSARTTPRKMKDQTVLLHTPYILDELQQQLREGKFQRHMTELENWQTKLTELGDEAESECGEDTRTLFLKIRPAAVFESDAWDLFVRMPDENKNYDLIEKYVSKEAESLNERPRTALEINAAIEEIIKRQYRKALQNRDEILENLSIYREGKRGLEGVADAMLRVEGIPLKAQDLPVLSGELPRAKHNLTNSIKESALLVEENLRRRQMAVVQDGCEDLVSILKNLDADYLIRSLRKSVRRKLEVDARVWSSRCADIIRAKYWPEGNLKSDSLLKWIKEEYPETFKHHHAELLDVCTDVLVHFQSGTRVGIRLLFETMQRAVLEGKSPLPAGAVTKNSILKRWRSILRQRLKSRLHGFWARDNKASDLSAVEKAKPKTPPNIDNSKSTHDNGLVADAAIFNASSMSEENLDEICDLILSIDAYPGDDLLNEFVLWARGEDIKVLAAILSEMHERQPEGNWRKRLTKALKISRVAGDSTEQNRSALLNNLRRVLHRPG